MDEIFPLLGGVVLALAASQLRPAFCYSVIALLTPLLAYTAAKISGELDINWGYLLLDMAEVALMAVAIMALISWRRRAHRLTTLG